MIRNMKIVVVIPGYSATSGGIKRMLRLVEQLHIRGYDVGLHVQRDDKQLQNLPIPVTYGVPSVRFQGCDTIISYSDDPYIESYRVLLPNVNLLVYMLSFGMCLERERKVLNSGATILCSTEKILNAVTTECFKSYKIGFSLEEQVKNFYIDNPHRGYATIMYHPAEAKKYDLACDVVDVLDKDVIVFGRKPVGNIRMPKRCRMFFVDVSSEVLRRIFNMSDLYVMPSVTEGLNLTPIEAALCGCTSVYCDGANEIYDNIAGCYWSDPDLDSMLRYCQFSEDQFTLSEQAHSVAVRHTWGGVMKNLEAFL